MLEDFMPPHSAFDSANDNPAGVSHPDPMAVLLADFVEDCFPDQFAAFVREAAEKGLHGTQLLERLGIIHNPAVIDADDKQLDAGHVGDLQLLEAFVEEAKGQANAMLSSPTIDLHAKHTDKESGATLAPHDHVVSNIMKYAANLGVWITKSIADKKAERFEKRIIALAEKQASVALSSSGDALTAPIKSLLADCLQSRMAHCADLRKEKGWSDAEYHAAIGVLPRVGDFDAAEDTHREAMKAAFGHNESAINDFTWLYNFAQRARAYVQLSREAADPISSGSNAKNIAKSIKREMLEHFNEIGNPNRSAQVSVEINDAFARFENHIGLHSSRGR